MLFRDPANRSLVKEGPLFQVRPADPSGKDTLLGGDEQTNDSKKPPQRFHCLYVVSDL